MPGVHKDSECVHDRSVLGIDECLRDVNLKTLEKHGAVAVGVIAGKSWVFEFRVDLPAVGPERRWIICQALFGFDKINDMMEIERLHVCSSLQKNPTGPEQI